MEYLEKKTKCPWELSDSCAGDLRVNSLENFYDPESVSIYRNLPDMGNTPVPDTATTWVLWRGLAVFT